MKNLKKLNAKGFAHWIVPVLAIVVIGGIGSYVYLRQSHADSLRYIQVINTGSGAAPTITVYPNDGYKKTGNNVNTLKIYGSYGGQICGYPNSTYIGSAIYNENGAPQLGAKSTTKYIASGSKVCGGSFGGGTWNLCYHLVKVKFNYYFNTGDGYYGYVKKCTLNNTTVDAY